MVIHTLHPPRTTRPATHTPHHTTGREGDSTTHPPHHGWEGGQYYGWPMTMAGRVGMLDHLYIYVYLQLNELFIYNQLTYLGFLKMMFNFSQRDIHITGEWFCTKISSRTSENRPGFDRSGGSSWSLLDGWNDDFWVYLKMWIWGHHGIFIGI